MKTVKNIGFAMIALGTITLIGSVGAVSFWAALISGVLLIIAGSKVVIEANKVLLK